MQYSSKDLVNGKCSHRQYYSQYVGEEEKAMVSKEVSMKTLLEDKTILWKIEIPLTQRLQDDLICMEWYMEYVHINGVYGEAAMQIVEEYRRKKQEEVIDLF